jgi:ArsR family transcriptional regulator
MRCCSPDAPLCRDLGGLAQQLKVLAEPNRLKIVCLLARGELCVCKLYEALELPQNLVSHHLAVLRRHEIVQTRKQGTWVHYRLNQKVVQKLSSTLQHIINEETT